jgi:hypothetical protein
MGKAEEGIEVQKVYIRPGFLKSLPSYTVRYGLAILHKAGRYGPEAVLGFYGSSAQENFVVPFRDTAHNHLRIFIMDGLACVTDIARAIVSGRHAQLHRIAAVAAIFHNPSLLFLR